MELKQFTEDSITLMFGEEINEETNKLLVNTRKYIDKLNIKGVLETVISYTRLVIYFDILETSAAEVEVILKEIDFEALAEENFPHKVVEVPVCYGGDFGPDMDLFEDEGISADEIVERHANREYLIYMLGFMPGFVYLGGLDPKLARNRLDDPRTNIPAGSVGIAGEQTGMYPFDSPGGWNLIGRTPILLYDPRRGEDTILYDAGDCIIFYPISADEYKKIEKQVIAGTYEVKIRRETS